jgi:hypothetical protein
MVGNRLSWEIQPIVTVEHGAVWELLANPTLELFGLEGINPP